MQSNPTVEKPLIFMRLSRFKFTKAPSVIFRVRRVRVCVAALTYGASYWSVLQYFMLIYQCLQ